MSGNQPYEDSLLREAEGLDLLVKLFTTFDSLIEHLLEQYGEHLDPHLVTCLEIIRYEVNLTLNGVVPLNTVQVQGLVKQLDEVMEQIEVFQAGIQTKSGIPDEQLDDTTSG